MDRPDGERIAVLEARLEAMALDVIELAGDARDARRRVGALELVEAARDGREQRVAAELGRRFAVAGLALTALNVTVAVVAVVLGG